MRIPSTLLNRICSPVLPARLTLLFVLALGILAYFPGLSGPFLFDDYVNIVWNNFNRVETLDYSELRDAAFSGPGSTSIPRPLSRLSFGLNYYFSGGQLDAFAFKVSNLVIHLVNALLVYLLSGMLLSRLRRGPGSAASMMQVSGPWSWFPVVVTAIWLLHPIQLSSVLYVVQRMNTLAAFFSLAGVSLYVAGRTRLEAGRPFAMVLMFCGLGGATVLGFSAKENAALTPLFALLVEFLCFRRDTLAPGARHWVGALFAVSLFIPMLLVLVYVLSHPEFIGDLYLAREFGLAERLLTESRILFFYLSLVFFPSLRSFGLFHEDIPLSLGLFTPWSTALSLFALVVLLLFALRSLRRNNVLAFAILWYLCGHSMESSFIALEITHEHRNYLPLYGVFFALAYFLFHWIEVSGKARRRLPLLIILVIGVLGFLTHVRANIWGNIESFVYFSARNHPDSYRAQYQLGNFHDDQRHDVRLTFKAYQRASAANPAFISGLVRMQRLSNGLLIDITSDKLQSDAKVPIVGELDILHVDLVLDPEYLSRLGRGIGTELERRLREERVNAETFYGMEELERCLLARLDYCASAPKVLGWYATLLKREHMSSAQRSDFLASVAKIHGSKGNFPQALEYADRAVRANPGKAEWQVLHASFLIENGKFERAEAVLSGLEERPGLQGIFAREARFLRQQIPVPRAQDQGE